ncbi:MAG: glycosyltransferase family 2 protein [Saprospiraceae bacterium]|nr:glycosyltransferase family 2 protein [Saprospiraceae bacterium]
MKNCLTSIISSDHADFEFEIIVIDNNSSDDTFSVVQGFMKDENHKIIYYKEERVGLYNARQAGANIAHGKYLIYIDDDAVLMPNFFEVLAPMLHEGKYDAIGGECYPWFYYGKPRWMAEDYGMRNIPVAKEINSIYETPHGGIMVIKDYWVERIGWDTMFGMSGRKVAYGEDTYFFKEMLEQKAKIYFQPNLAIRHIITMSKLSLLWQLKAQYAMSRDTELILHNQRSILLLVPLTISFFIKNIPKYTLKFFFTKDYYWENYLLDVGQNIAHILGIASSKFRKL